MRISSKKINKQFNNKIPYRFINITAFLMIVLAFIINTPPEIVNGFKLILLKSGTLITDYIEIGGIGASLVNSALLVLIVNHIFHRYKVKFTGVTYAAIFMILGFSFFGKNIINIWPILLGVKLYSSYQNENFKRYIYIAIFGTAMSPIISEIFLFPNFDFAFRVVLGLLTGSFIGFILPNIAAHLVTVHHGYNLYNVGFAAGIIGTIFVSIYKSYGLHIESNLYWSTGNNYSLGIILISYFIIMVIFGYFMNHKSFKGIKTIYKSSGRLVTDFVSSVGHGATFINMGINGIISTGAIITLNGDLNGATIAGIFTIVGFGAFGKHLRNIIPIWIGLLFGVYTGSIRFTNPGIQLAFLFCTGLAPIAGEFGIFYGILAGYIHSALIMYIGVLHGGVNLYNNGFSAGIVAGFLIPVIDAIRKD